MSFEITEYHAKYYAHDLLRSFASNSPEKLTATFANAPQVDLNPHQVRSALFAFDSPLSSGAILADEVGLGKTIEAGILLSQKWAERKRKILVILPANLRLQWKRELGEKFYLPSRVLDGTRFKQLEKKGQLNPFRQDAIVLSSYHFAANKAEYLANIDWDLVVIDEAHRLRNVYKEENIIANALRDALSGVPKVLLTATPLQNSLMELYGLVSFIDPKIFGDEESFSQRYCKERLSPERLDELKIRLEPVCLRTLRSQVREYIRYTKRISIVQDFVPTASEQELYDRMSAYLSHTNLYAFSRKARHLISLLLFKLMASSTFAIAGTLHSIACRLRRLLADEYLEDGVNWLFESLAQDFDIDELEIGSLEEATDGEAAPWSIIDSGLRCEIAEVEAMRDLALSIKENAKGEGLIRALKMGFLQVDQMKASEKAIIFTESRRTQLYIRQVLEKTQYRGKIVLFNGTNSDRQSVEIYEDWRARYEGSARISGSRAVDTKAALVDYFRNEATIMIATEAAAEGLNLQFCSLIVNYDLPWNPQRIEQRIGRCHRYGQAHDVVVVNFLNRSNYADQHVYNLLDQKFKLFSGVFGASDDAIGLLDDGVSLEKRILEIYQNCRRAESIELAFNQIRRELDQKIQSAMRDTRKSLLANFDSEVHERLKVNFDESCEFLDRYQSRLFSLTNHILREVAEFDLSSRSFKLLRNPFDREEISLGKYSFCKSFDAGLAYRSGHPLAQSVLEVASELRLPYQLLEFNYSEAPQKSSILENLVGASGDMTLTKLMVSGEEAKDYLIWAAKTDNGCEVDAEQCDRLFSICDCQVRPASGSSLDLDAMVKSEVEKVDREIRADNDRFFHEEETKLKRWASDRKRSLQIKIKDALEEIKKIRNLAHRDMNDDERDIYLGDIMRAENKCSRLRNELLAADHEIEDEREFLLEDARRRLNYSLKRETLFSVRFSVA